MNLKSKIWNVCMLGLVVGVAIMANPALGHAFDLSADGNPLTLKSVVWGD